MKKFFDLNSLFVRGLALSGLTLVMLAACQSETAEQKRQNDQEQAARAEAEFEQSANRAPTTKTLYAISRILSAQHRDAECQMVLYKIIVQQHDFMPAYNDLAELQMRERKIDTAEQTLNAGLKVDPKQGVLLNNMGMCHLLEGHYQDALTWFTRAAGADPDDTRFRANMALALGMLGRYDESLALYLQVTSASDAHYNLGVVADSRNDHERAVKEYDLAKTLEAAAESATKSQ